MRSKNHRRQPRAAQKGNHEDRPAKSNPKGKSGRETSLGDKAAAASRPFGDFGNQQPSHWEVRTPIGPIASSYLGKKWSRKKNESTQIKRSLWALHSTWIPLVWSPLGLLKTRSCIHSQKEATSTFTAQVLLITIWLQQNLAAKRCRVCNDA